MSEGSLVAGLHERLLTAELRRQLQEIPDLVPSVHAVDPADDPHVLARHVYDLTLRSLAATREPRERLRIVNGLAATLADVDAAVEEPAAQLLALTPPASLVSASSDLSRPSTPLSETALLTNAPGEPNLGSELRAEIDTADGVDLLCAFVKWHGLRLLEPQLRRANERDVPIRVVTTTYMGATERAALDRLVKEFGAEVKVQYDAARTRLHAKAWFFRRSTTFDTAYVGSSNLSRAALLDGVEWNVRLSRVGTPTLLHKFAATFETYWNDQSFETYDPATGRDRLDDALAEASGRSRHDQVTITLAGLEVRPYPYQQSMLDALDAERRVHGRHHNLVVAATGTGKTVLAALDYRRLCGSDTSHRPTLLFVAHRREILHQALRTYREVLADANFGELYVHGRRPERGRHVFASIQSLNSHGVGTIPQGAFEVVVIDEFHHAEAASYRRVLDHLQPEELLGLTATPERADGTDVRSFFDGRIAAELRLWDALGADLLCPFHYFAVADGTDLRRVSWTRGRYDDQQLGNLYTGNRARAAIILSELRDKIVDPGGMRALGFCVSIDHAHFMAESFGQAGISSAVVTGRTSQQDRDRALQDLRDRRVNVVFAVDVFNEGLDIPDVDTVLFLRPTESATIFLQQLGRGLRRTPHKAVLTVLDFVGHHRREFRFDRKLRALTGLSRRELERQVERQFPFLPSGCQIVMDRQSQEIVLENIRSQVANRWGDMVAELRSHPTDDLRTFLDESGVELADVLRRGQRSWTELKRDAGVSVEAGAESESRLLRRIRAFAHVDDVARRDTYARLSEAHAPAYDDLNATEQRLARMLFFSAFPDAGKFASYEAGLAAMRSELTATSEVRSIVDLAFDDSRQSTLALGAPLEDVPLRIHARYQREEILAALDYASLSRKPTSVMQGVAYSEALNVDILFVTLRKSEADFSPTTMYRDYPISPTQFHWESQSTTSLKSPTGQRYVTGSSTVLLFVREDQHDDFGTRPYVFLGPAHYESYEGERPIAITWRLDHPMPADFFAAASVAAG